MEDSSPKVSWNPDNGKGSDSHASTNTGPVINQPWSRPWLISHAIFIVTRSEPVVSTDRHVQRRDVLRHNNRQRQQSVTTSCWYGLLLSKIHESALREKLRSSTLSERNLCLPLCGCNDIGFLLFFLYPLPPYCVLGSHWVWVAVCVWAFDFYSRCWRGCSFVRVALRGDSSWRVSRIELVINLVCLGLIALSYWFWNVGNW